MHTRLIEIQWIWICAKSNYSKFDQVCREKY